MLHIRENTPGDDSIFLSAVYDNEVWEDISDKDIQAALKLAAATFDYPTTCRIPVDRIDMHLLCIGRANALSLAGFSHWQIQKLGKWQGKTFKEYVCEQLSNFSEGMSTSMKKTFGFVNVEVGVFHDITYTVLTLPYLVAVSQSA
jgi:hypothetical protein